MPQASDELRSTMTQRFGDIGTAGPEEFLRSRGWTLTPSWDWVKANATFATIPPDELECIEFLCDEWDYGGFFDLEGKRQ